MNISKNITIVILLMITLVKLSQSQMLTVDRCFSGTKDDYFYSSFKMKEDDSIRYLIIGSSSLNNFFDSVVYTDYLYEPYGRWMVALNENTRSTIIRYIGNYFDYQVVGNEICIRKFQQYINYGSIKNIYTLKLDRNLNIVNSEILIDTFPLSGNGLLGSYFTKSDSVLNLYEYQYSNVAIDRISVYKLNKDGIISSSNVSTLRTLNDGYIQYITNLSDHITISNNKIYESIGNVLKIYNAEAEEIASFEILNNYETISKTTLINLKDSSVFLRIQNNKSELNLVKINKDNTLAYNIKVPFDNYIYPNDSTTKYLFYSYQNIIDSNLVVPLINGNHDSMYYVKLDYYGNVIHTFAEKITNGNNYILNALEYNNTTRIILKNKGGGSNVEYIQKIDRNGVPVSSIQLPQSLYYQGNLLFLFSVHKMFKVKNRYFIVGMYNTLTNDGYSVILEYLPANNSLLISAVLPLPLDATNQNYFGDIFMNYYNQTFVIANTNEGCIRNADVVLYKLADGINTVQGKIYIDYNNNNTQDNGEPNYENGLLSYTKNNVSYSTYLIDTGKYTFIIDTGKYNVKFKPADSIFTVSPINRIVNHTNYNNTDFINFILKPIGVVYDAKIVMNNTFVTRPGFSGTYAITISNNGNQPLNNFTIKLLLDNRLIPDSSNIPYIINNDTLIWNITNTIQAAEHKTFYIYFTAKTPTALNNNDLLESIVTVFIPQHDTNFANNEFKFAELARGSYDPNEKMVNEDKLSMFDVANKKSLLYTIRFENIGTDTAFNITIQDTLPNNTDINSFKPIASSHPYTLTVKNKNILTFYFKNIRLPYKSINQAKSHGFVSYEIKPDINVALNDQIKNTAHIIFDYNLPVSTNTATTLIQVVTNNNNNQSLQNKIFIYPNPAAEQIEIQFKNIKLNNATLKLMDILGNVILSQNISQDFLNLDISQLASGTYVLALENNHQIQTSKIIISR